MVRKKWALFRFANIIADLCLVLISYYAAFLIRHDLLGGVITIDVRAGMYSRLAIIYAFSVVLGLYLLHVYERQQIMKIGKNIARILMVNTVGVIIMDGIALCCQGCSYFQNGFYHDGCDCISFDSP